jgi:hypothetical protein
VPENTEVSKPNLRLKGNTEDGYALDWNPNKKGIQRRGFYFIEDFYFTKNFYYFRLFKQFGVIFQYCNTKYYLI